MIGALTEKETSQKQWVNRFVGIHCTCVFFFKAFNLEYYTEVLDLSYLLDHFAKDPFFKNFRRLNKKLIEVIQDYSLVSFIPLNVQVSGYPLTAVQQHQKVDYYLRTLQNGE